MNELLAFLPLLYYSSKDRGRNLSIFFVHFALSAPK